MKKLLTLPCLLASVGFLLTGCGNNNYALSKKDVAAFNDSPPEMKQTWEKGLQADKANDYLTAGNTYRSLLSQPISPDQLVAVQTALGGLNLRMNDAAVKGDAAAQKALEAAKASTPRR